MSTAPKPFVAGAYMQPTTDSAPVPVELNDAEYARQVLLLESGVTEDIFDEVDSSVTRTEAKWNLLFRAANLKIVATELQEGFPEELFPVRTWALQPDDS